jgi:hypothetical protein
VTIPASSSPPNTFTLTLASPKTSYFYALCLASFEMSFNLDPSNYGRFQRLLAMVNRVPTTFDFNASYSTASSTPPLLTVRYAFVDHAFLYISIIHTKLNMSSAPEILSSSASSFLFTSTYFTSNLRPFIFLEGLDIQSSSTDIEDLSMEMQVGNLTNGVITLDVYTNSAASCTTMLYFLSCCILLYDAIGFEQAFNGESLIVYTADYSNS